MGPTNGLYILESRGKREEQGDVDDINTGVNRSGQPKVSAVATVKCLLA